MTKRTAAGFWDSVAAKYDRGVVKGPNYRARVERAARWLREAGGRVPGGGGTVVDVGCAGGHITIDLAAALGDGVRVVGVDVSAKLVGMARSRAEAEGATNVMFVVGTVEDAGLAPGWVDGVTAYSELHLVDDPREELRRYGQLLRPGGVLIAEAPCREDIGVGWRVLIRGMTAVGKAPVVRLFEARQWAAMLREAGFEVREVKVYNPKSRSRSFWAVKD
jgi:SAM-dependent methyltransferase